MTIFLSSKLYTGFGDIIFRNRKKFTDFGKFKLLKKYLRSTIGQEQLSSLFIISIVYNIFKILIMIMQLMNLVK